MKSTRFIIITILLLLFSTITFIACKRIISNEDTVYKNVLNKPLATNQIIFANSVKLTNSVEKIESRTLTYNKYGINKTYSANYTKLKSHELRELVRNLTTYDLEPVGLVIYFSKNIKPNELITQDIVTAFSFYTIKNGDCFHQIYIKDKGVYIIDSNYSIISNLRNSNNSAFILNNIIPASLNSTSFIYINNADNNQVGKSKKDVFLLKEAVFHKNWLKTSSVGKRPVPGGGTGGNSESCGDGPGCESGPYWALCVPVLNSAYYSCGVEPPICERNESYSMLLNSNLYNLNDLNNAYSDLHYILRDSLLYYSSVGNKYIRYYYAISNTIYQETDLAFAYKCFSALPEMNSIISKLLNPDGYENEVLISAEYAEELNSIIND